jgi:hypothetical protein
MHMQYMQAHTQYMQNLAASRDAHHTILGNE